MIEPTRDDWQALYQTTIEFKEAAPWQWMGNDDLFAVENPADGQVGYCSVLGFGGEEFGLAVFLGAEGFEGYRKLMMEEVELEDLETSVLLRSLSATFVDREFTAKRDRDVIRSLGLRFRGRKAWPLFRSHLPGYVPWYLDREEVLFLDIALRQAIRVSERVRDGTIDLFQGVDEAQVLTFWYRDGEWRQEWRVPEVVEHEAESPEPADEVRLQRLRDDKAFPPQGKWEVDFFLLPAVIDTGEGRPYYPCSMLAMNQQGLVVGVEMVSPWASAAERQEAFIELLEQSPGLPREILVAKKEVRRLLEPVTKFLGIPTRLAKIRTLEAVKEALFQSL